MEKTKACPECQKSGHDSGGDHMFLMQNGDRYCCNRKEYHESGENYYEDADGEELLATVKAIASRGPDEPSSTIPVSVPVGTIGAVRKEYRGIREDVYHRYSVQGRYGPGAVLVALEHKLYDTGSPLTVVSTKVRKLPKSFFTTSPIGDKKVQLFGQRAFPRAKRLLITEGELDAMSAYQMLEKYRVACVSLPFGANVKAVLDNLGYFKGFKEVIVCVDQDEPGRKLSKEIASVLPHALFMKISEKDANDMLRNGKESEFISAFFDAQVYQPDMIVRVKDIMGKVLEVPKMGTPWPWPSLTRVTYGRRDGEGMYVGAGVKIGKSEFINQLVAFDVLSGRKIAVLKYEEVPAQTVKRVAGKIDGCFYHKPDVTFNAAQLEKTALSMHEYLYMYPAFGPATWDSTKEFIRFAAMSGCKTIVIDPVTKLTNALDSSETERELRKLSDEIACMAQDMGFFYIITCHLKAPMSGPPHERGGNVQSNQFRGSRAMMENCFYMLGIQRNKDPDLSEEERNTSTFVLLEDRAFGNSTKFPVLYSPLDQSYTEPALKF
jgi:twinkle protein